MLLKKKKNKNYLYVRVEKKTEIDFSYNLSTKFPTRVVCDF